MVTVLLLAFLAGLYFVLRRALAHKNLSVRQFFTVYFFSAAGGAMVLLGLSGRLHWLFALLGGAMSFFLRLLPMFLQTAMGRSAEKTGRGPATGGRSEMATPWVKMVLFHDSGEMDGVVLKGVAQGAKLSDMTLADVLTLLHAAAGDADTVSVLRAYLDRQHPGWTDEAGQQAPPPPAGDNAELTTGQALEVLGLPEDASREDIVDAHKRLIQKIHPDRGGSTWLAAMINRAKDTLLK